MFSQIFTPTCQYFYTDISIISVIFWNHYGAAQSQIMSSDGYHWTMIAVLSLVFAAVFVSLVLMDIIGALSLSYISDVFCWIWWEPGPIYWHSCKKGHWSLRLFEHNTIIAESVNVLNLFPDTCPICFRSPIQSSWWLMGIQSFAWQHSIMAPQIGFLN